MMKRTHIRMVAVVLSVLCLASCSTIISDYELKAHLKSIVLPSASYKDVSLRDLVKSLNVDHSEELQSAVILVIMHRSKTTDLITLRMKNVSMYDLLKIIAERTDSKLIYNGSQVYLQPREPRLMTGKELRRREETSGSPFDK